MAVEVPLHIVDGILPENLADGFHQIIPDFLPGEIQHQLMAAEGMGIIRCLQRPIRVCAVEVGVHADHFRLEPEAELQPPLVGRLCHPLETIFQLGHIDLPVTQRGIVITPLAEPAVIQDQKLNAQILGSLCQMIHLLIIEVEIGGLPVVHQNGPQGITVLAPHNVMAHHFVEGLAHTIEALAAVGQPRLRGLEALFRLQMPAEALGIDAPHHTGSAELLHLGLEGELAAPHQAEAVDLATGLPCVLPRQCQERRLLMGACSPATAIFLYPPHKAHPLQAALRCMSPVKGKAVKVMVREIQGKAGSPGKVKGFTADIGQFGIACYDRQFGKNRIA